MMEWVKVKDFATVITGGTPSTKKAEYWKDGNIAWLNSGELNQDIIRKTKNYITELGLKNSAAKLMPESTVLIALTGATTGVIGYLTFEASANQSVTGILPSEKHIPKYLYYYLKSIRRKVLNDAYGGAQPHISQGYVKEIRIPLPPLPQQRKIAAILDAADAYRQKTKELIKKYDELSQSLFLDMFGDPVRNPMGWQVKPLSDVCLKITDGTHHSPEPQDSGVPYVTAKHIKPFKLEFDSKPSFINELAHKEIYKRCTPEQGDVLYIKDGATTGIACINTFNEPISLLSSLALLKLGHKVNNHFLCHWLNHEGIKRKLIVEFMSGAAIKRYTLKKINLFRLIVPDISLQNHFADRVMEIESQKAQAQKSLKKAEELFASFLQRAFKGDLT